MTLAGALVSCTFLGLQHGIDVDHVAAITDVISVQRTPLEATRCGLLYTVGHAATVGLLGIGVIALKHSVPPQASAWMERVIGLTLVLLGVYVLSSLLTKGVVMGRGRALVAMFNHLRRRPGSGTDADAGYGRKSSLSLGVLHGIGAETPTQLSVLLIASNLGGIQNGILGLAVFAVGMFVSNMVLTTAATGIFSVARARPTVFRFLAVFTASYSLWSGSKMILG
jgi:high-affinity nickel-transport protein